jgi:glycosyltransferase involved in cell wall biosynthesis
MEKPLVSICTPVYNGERFLEKCIKGVLNQIYQNFEYVIVDNASTDQTPQIIEKFRKKDGRIKVFRNDQTIKIIDNFNACAGHISENSRWIKYALADDYLFPNCVEEMVRVGEMDLKIGFVSSYHLYDRKVANVGLPLDQNVANGQEMLRLHILRKLHVCLNSPNTLLYKRSVFEEFGQFDNSFLHADTELALRILDKYNLGFVHQVLTWTGVHVGRGANYSFDHGIFTREYMQFGLKDIGKYKSVKFTDEEIDQISEKYADEVVMYIAKYLAYFKWSDIHTMLKEAPPSVKGKLFKAVARNCPLYLRIFLGSVYHYKNYLRNKPTFEG